MSILFDLFCCGLTSRSDNSEYYSAYGWKGINVVIQLICMNVLYYLSANCCKEEALWCGSLLSVVALFHSRLLCEGVVV